MGGSDEAWLAREYCHGISEQVAGQAADLIQQQLAILSVEVPELRGEGPPLSDLAERVLAANLDSIRTAICSRAPLEDVHVPAVNLEYARLLAQNGVPAFRLLLGYQVVRRGMTHMFIDQAAAMVQDHDDLVRTVEGVLAYVFAYCDAASQAVLAAHAGAQSRWLSTPAAGLARRLTAVLDGTITDAKVAERMLGYPVAGYHATAIIWTDDDVFDQLGVHAAADHLRALPGMHDVLLVQHDERTLFCWLHSSEGDG
ncbi:MAG: hypothetical protein JXA57_17440 [Armatimonadetes bacterium]|nr:hypothetical protein [Armatimonadota bacterium]